MGDEIIIFSSRGDPHHHHLPPNSTLLKFAPTHLHPLPTIYPSPTYPSHARAHTHTFEIEQTRSTPDPVTYWPKHAVEGDMGSSSKTGFEFPTIGEG